MSKSRIKKTSSIKDIRAFYGMTQQALADYLQVGRPLLSMAELSQRELPDEARAKLDRIQLAIQNTAAPNRGKAVKSNQNELKSEALEEAKHRVRHNPQKLVRMEKALAKLQSDHNRVTHILASLEALSENASPMDLSLFSVLASDAEILYNRTGEDAQLNLELRMEALKAETAYLKKKFKDSLDK